MTADQVAALLGARPVARNRRRLVVSIPYRDALLNRQVERDIGITPPRRPHYRLAAGDPGNPDARMRLLQRQHPGVNNSKLVVLALPAPRTRSSPGLNNQVVRFLETCAVKSRVDVGGDRLDSAAADESRYQPALGDHVDHR